MTGETSTAHIDRNDPKLRTLTGLFSTFMGQPSSQLLAGITVASLITRLTLNAWSSRDLAIAFGIIALWPIQEVIAHRFILHARPFTLFGRTFDVGKYHRDHHADPLKLDGFVAVKLFCVTPVIELAICRLVAGNWPEALTAFSTWFALAFNYEWSHFFVHAPYQPKTWWGRMLRRNHMLHHYHHEKFWWEVSTGGLIDRLLIAAKGFPFSSTQRDIPRSKTVYTVF